MAIRSDIKLAAEWFIGARKQFIFPVTDAAGNPVDITGWEIEWALMKKPNALDYLIHKTSANVTEISFDNGALAFPNRVIVEVPAEDTAGLRASAVYYHELKRTDTDDVLTYGDAVLKLSGVS